MWWQIPWLARDGHRCPADQPRPHQLRGQGVRRAPRGATRSPPPRSRGMAGLPRQRIYDVLAASSRRASRRRGRAPSSSTRPSRRTSRSSGSRRPARASWPTSSATRAAMIDAAHARPSRPGQAHTDPLEYIEVLRDRRRDQRALRRAPGGGQATRSSSSRSRRTRRRRRRTSRASRSRQTHEARSVYELVGLRRPRRRSRASGGSSRPARRRASSTHLPLKLVIIDESIVMFGMEDPVAGSAS